MGARPYHGTGSRVDHAGADVDVFQGQYEPRWTIGGAPGAHRALGQTGLKLNNTGIHAQQRGLSMRLKSIGPAHVKSFKRYAPASVSVPSLIRLRRSGRYAGPWWRTPDCQGPPAGLSCWA